MPRACVAGLVRPWRVPVVRSAMMPRSERPVPPQRHLRGRYVRTFVVQLVPLRLQPTQVRCFIPHRELELLDLGAVIPAQAILAGGAGLSPHRDSARSDCENKGKDWRFQKCILRKAQVLGQKDVEDGDSARRAPWRWCDDEIGKAASWKSARGRSPR